MAKRITKFSQITEQLPYPSGYRGLLQSIHSTIVSEVLGNSSVTRSYCKNAVHIVNMVSYYCICSQEELGWRQEAPLTVSNEDIDEDMLELHLKDMYLSFRFIKWELDGLEIVAESEQVELVKTLDESITQKVKSEILAKKILSIEPNAKKTIPNSATIIPTSKDDLSIQPPQIPQFDFNNIRCSLMFGDRTYTIYESLPIIPKKQNQISITTDISKMSKGDLYNLYPNCRILTRHQPFYDRNLSDGLYYHPVLGAIIPVEGFTKEQIIDNIIKYPHFYRLSKLNGEEQVGFYSTIEINGELQKTLQIWETLPESKVIPPIKDYMQEYVVRRYLLERDIKGIKHKYPMFGTLEPFMTLFTTPEEYIELGYTDIDGMARQCVNARVSYKKSRNPVLRLVNKMANTPGVIIQNTLG